MVCYELQQRLRAKLLDSVKVHKAGRFYWMTVAWGEWFSCGRTEPTTRARLEFVQKALAWAANSNDN